MDAEAEQEARDRLERDYLAGSISADEYTRLRRRLHEGLPLPAEPQVEPRLASWGRRAVALVLDWLILVPLTGAALAGAVNELDAAVFRLALVLFPFLYHWLMVGRWGQTLGKMALGIRVVRAEDAGRVGYARAAGRVAAVWVLGILVLPLLLAYLWPLWDRRNQTLYDKIVSTIVVRVEGSG